MAVPILIRRRLRRCPPAAFQIILTRLLAGPMLVGNGSGRMGVPRGRSADHAARSGRAQRGKSADLRCARSLGTGPRAAHGAYQVGDPRLTSTTARAAELRAVDRPTWSTTQSSYRVRQLQLASGPAWLDARLISVVVCGPSSSWLPTKRNGRTPRQADQCRGGAPPDVSAVAKRAARNVGSAIC